MFSFASKMLNNLIGEGETQPQDPQGYGQQPQPMFRPPSTRPPGVGFRGPTGPMGPLGPGPGHGTGLGPGPGIGPQRFPSPGLRTLGPRTDLRPRLGMARPQAGPSHMMQRPPPPIVPGDDMAVDLSHLSEEERALIQNVMAKAKEIEEPPAAPAFPSHAMDIPGNGRGMGLMDGRNIGAGIDGRGLGAGMDGRSLGSTLDGRGMGSGLDGRGLGQMDARGLSQMDSRSLGQMDSRGLGQMDSRGLGQMDSRSLGQMDSRGMGQMDSRSLGQMDSRSMGQMDSRGIGQMDSRGMGQMDSRGMGQMDSRGMGQMDSRGMGQMDSRGLGQIDARGMGHLDPRGLGQLDARGVGQTDNRGIGQMDGRGMNQSLDGSIMGPPMDGRGLSATADGRGLAQTLNGRTVDGRNAGSAIEPQHRQELGTTRPLHGSFQSQDTFPSSLQKDSFLQQRQDSFSSSAKPDSFFSNNVWENQAPDKDPLRTDPCQLGGSTEEEYSSEGIYSRTFPRPQNPALRSTTSTLGSLENRDGRGELSKALHSESSFSRSTFSSRTEEPPVSDATKRNGVDLDHFLGKNSELGLIMKQQQAAQQAKQQQQLQQKLQQQLAQEAQQHQQQMLQQQQQPQNLQQCQQSLQQQPQQSQQQQQQTQQHQQFQLQDQPQQQTHQLQASQEQQRNHQIHQQQSLMQQHQQDHLLQQTAQQKQQQINQPNLNQQQNQNINQQTNHPLSHQQNSQHLQQTLDHKSNYSKSQLDHISSLQQERQIWDRINNHSYGLQKDYNQDHLYQQKLQQERMQEQEYSTEQKQFLQRSNEYSNSPLHRGKPKLHELQGDYFDELGSRINPLNFQKSQQQQLQQQQQQGNAGQNKPAAGTISGMLADFSRALGLGGNSPSRPSPTEERLDSEQSQQSSQQYAQDYLYNKDRQTQQQPLRSGDQFFNRATSQQQPGTQLPHSNQIEFPATQQQYQQQTQYDNKSLQQQQYLRTQQHLPLQEQQQLQQQQMQAQQQQQQQQQFQQQQQLLQAEQQLQQQHKNQQVLQQQQQHQQQHLNMLVQQQQHLILQQQRQKHHLDQTDGSLHQAQFGLQKMQHEYHPMFAQNLTPQQQQMYQQHMQLQHHAQHLKKIRRSLPNSSTALESTLQQGQLQKQKKDLNVNVLGGASLGASLGLQSVGSGGYLTQGVLLGNQLISGGLLAATNTQNRLSTASSQPIMSSSIMAAGLVHSSIPGGTPIVTPQSTPVGTPRGPRDTGGDSSDTLSETDSQKSLRMRRKLPAIPPDQEAAPLPTSKKRDRNKNAKAAQQAERFRTYSPLRQYTLDSGYPVGLSNLMLQRPSASETNLRKVSMGVESVPRPGSALGLLQASSVVSSSGVRISTDYSRDFDRGNPPLTDLVSCLPPDLRHLLGSYKTPSSDTTAYSKQLPLSRSLGDEVKLTAADRRLLNSFDRDDRLLLDRTKDVLRNQKNRLELQRKMVYSGLGRSRKIRTHRRQLSDPKIHLDFHSGKEDSSVEIEYGRGYLGFTHPSLRPPYKSYEYESIDDGNRADWDPSQSYLATSYAVAGGALRETAINSVLDNGHHFTDHNRYDVRRYSDGLDMRRRDVSKTLRNKPRSWQPSPYGSDEDDDQLTREEKKAKIKAEIARRRQQIEENARLHEELLRLARLRESAELGFTPGSHSGGGYAISSVLKSIDDLLLSGRGRGDELYDTRRMTRRTPEDRSMDRIASTFRTDDYTSGVYERLTDFSPLTDFSTPHAMPLLPDMPTRSRKLLEDLGSSPITDSVRTLPQKAQALL